jgi:hypothetical protein
MRRRNNPSALRDASAHPNPRERSRFGVLHERERQKPARLRPNLRLHYY